MRRNRDHNRFCSTFHCCPISPIDDGWETIGDAPVIAEGAELRNGEPADIVHADEVEVIQPGRPLPEPRVPSKSEVAIHNLTHLPYRSWCPHCVRARRPNTQHRSKSVDSQRSVPLLVADYCYVKDIHDETISTLLVARLYPARALMATVCEKKGPEDEHSVARLALFIKESGYKKIVYRSDQEPSIRAIFEAAFKKACREGELYNPALDQMVPESSAVGESASNDRAENAVQRLEDLLRTYKCALETNVGFRIPVSHPVISWMVEHAASIYNRHVCNDEGTTPYEHIHGQRSRGKLAEFGEQVFYYVPKAMRAKLNLRFRLGTFLGNAQSANEAYVATSAGDVIKTRSIVRVVAPSRWSKDAISGIQGTPAQPKPFGPPELSELVEELQNPHVNADDDLIQNDGSIPIDGENAKKLDKQLRITLRDLNDFGFSERCPRCSDLQEGRYSSKKNHSQECRLRIYLAYKENNHPKWNAVKHLLDPDDKFDAEGVDREDAESIPKAQDGSNVLEPEIRNGGDGGAPATPTGAPEIPEGVLEDLAAEEQRQFDEAIAAAGDSDMEPEDNVADLFGDFEDDDGARMMDSLIIAGMTPEKAKRVSKNFRSHDPPTTFLEVYGRSVRDYSLITKRNFNVQGLDALDLRTVKPNGDPWDFRERSDRNQARQLLRDLKPMWVIGAPPCTAFSIWNYGMNYKKMDSEVVREKLAEGRAHLQFMCSLYRMQTDANRYYLHEHPATALSWKEDVIDALARRPETMVVTAHQCQYGLVTPSEEDPSIMMPALKPTKFLTNSPLMASQLQLKCKRDHKHQPLVGGRCRDASFYPPGLVRAILKGMILQTKEDEMNASRMEEEVAKIAAMPMNTKADSKTGHWEPTQSSIPLIGGGSRPVHYNPHNFRERYTDEYTGELLPTNLIRTAIVDELDYFNSKVWELSSKEQMVKYPEAILVRSRWVVCNKGDSTSPDVRARLVSCELNKDGRNDAFSASTPPLEAKKALFVKYASERTRKGQPLRISFVDIRKAYFNAVPQRDIFMQVPKELGLPPGSIARQIRCVYGTRDAGRLWEDAYTQVLEEAGFTTGSANPCVFHHKVRDISLVVHGDDFTAVGNDKDLDWYESKLKESFEIKIRGRLGEGCKGPQELRILNRVIALSSSGLTYEADPRHTDLLMSSLGLTDSNAVAAPGVKEALRDDVAVKQDEQSLPGIDADYSDPDAKIASICIEDESARRKPKNSPANSNAIPFSKATKSIFDHTVHSWQKVKNDQWACKGEFNTWIIDHSKTRRKMVTPCDLDCGPINVNSIASVRLTCGTYDNGELFSLCDSWRSGDNAHMELRRPWQGITAFFEDHVDVDARVAKICALHNSPMKIDERHVRFDESQNEHFNVPAYSEHYSMHPHFLLSSAHGWKRNPARCDPFTGKSSAVMKDRRAQVRRTLKPKNAHATRLRLMREANEELQQMLSMEESLVKLQKPTSDSQTGKMAATRTKPVATNKYQKRLGAKKAKKLEVEENQEYILSPQDATTYRALAARCNYMAQDRPDLSFSSKELCREFSVPNVGSFRKLKRLVRYLCGMPRLIYRYNFQPMPKSMMVYVDTDFAGCKETRRSTSGGTIMLGSGCVKHWSKTQSTISLSSGEAELHGICQGAAQALGMQSILKDMGWDLPIEMFSDATAAIGIARRKGLGKIRHLDVSDLWIQDKIRTKQISLQKVLGTENMADVLTKYVDRKIMQGAISKMGLEKMTGRPECAPIAMGA